MICRSGTTCRSRFEAMTCHPGLDPGSSATRAMDCGSGPAMTEKGRAMTNQLSSRTSHLSSRISHSSSRTSHLSSRTRSGIQCHTTTGLRVGARNDRERPRYDGGECLGFRRNQEGLIQGNQRSSNARSSGTLIGFARKSSTPTSRQRWRSRAKASALRAMMGQRERPVSVSHWRIRAVAL